MPYFKRVNVERGTQLWANGSEPDACVHLSLALALFLVDVLTLLLPRCRFYVIESGMLRATYVFANSAHTMTESMVAGTVAGEMSFLSRTPRNTNVVAERDSTLWKMEVGAHEELGRKEGWQFARRFEEVVLKIATAETEVLMVRPYLSLLRGWLTRDDELTAPRASRAGSPHVELVRRTGRVVAASLSP